MLDTTTNYIPPAPAPAATITVELTNEQIEALCEFASKGSDEWMHDRVACKEVFEPEEIEERNSLMDQCDAALANIRSAQNGSKTGVPTEKIINDEEIEARNALTDTCEDALIKMMPFCDPPEPSIVLMKDTPVKQPNVPVDPVAALSVVHLNEGEASELPEAISNGLIVGTPTATGFLLQAEHLTNEANLPHLNYVLGYLTALGFLWVLFDTNGETVEELAKFDWSASKA